MVVSNKHEILVRTPSILLHCDYLYSQAKERFMKKQIKLSGNRAKTLLLIIATAGILMAACTSEPGSTSGETSRSVIQPKTGVISYEIDANLQYLWTGADYENEEPVFGKTILFEANSIEGSSDVVFTIKTLLSEMVKEGDAKLIAKAGVIRFTGFFQGTDMSQIPQWYTYSLGDGGYALTIRDTPSRNNGQTTPDLFAGDRDF